MSPRTPPGGSPKERAEAERCGRPRAAQPFRAAGVFVVSLVSSPGSGKTAFLEKTLTAAACHVIVWPRWLGDLATENDAVRLARSQAPVKQIITGTLCHLEAAMVQKPLDEDGTSTNWIFSSSRTWATWFVRRPTIWVKICAWCCCRSQRVRTSHSSIRQFSTAPTSLSSPRWIWPRRSSSTGKPLRQHSGGPAGHAGLQALRQKRRRDRGVSGLPYGLPEGVTRRNCRLSHHRPRGSSRLKTGWTSSLDIGGDRPRTFSP